LGGSGGLETSGIGSGGNGSGVGGRGGGLTIVKVPGATTGTVRFALLKVVFMTAVRLEARRFRTSEALDAVVTEKINKRPVLLPTSLRRLKVVAVVEMTFTAEEFTPSVRATLWMKRSCLEMLKPASTALKYTGTGGVGGDGGSGLGGGEYGG